MYQNIQSDCLWVVGVRMIFPHFSLFLQQIIITLVYFFKSAIICSDFKSNTGLLWKK